MKQDILSNYVFPLKGRKITFNLENFLYLYMQKIINEGDIGVNAHYQNVSELTQDTVRKIMHENNYCFNNHKEAMMKVYRKIYKERRDYFFECMFFSKSIYMDLSSKELLKELITEVHRTKKFRFIYNIASLIIQKPKPLNISTKDLNLVKEIHKEATIISDNFGEVGRDNAQILKLKEQLVDILTANFDSPYDYQEDLL